MIGEEYGIIAMFIILIVHMIYSAATKKSIIRSVLISVFIIYISTVILITFFPIVYSHDEHTAFVTLEGAVQFIPFNTICRMIRYAPRQMAFEQVGGNIIMTIPFGILLPLLLKRKKVLQLILYAAALPVCIESLQLLLGYLLGTYYRMADIDDVILNFMGIIIGYIIYFVSLLIYRKVRKSRADHKNNDLTGA